MLEGYGMLTYFWNESHSLTFGINHKLDISTSKILFLIRPEKILRNSYVLPK